MDFIKITLMEGLIPSDTTIINQLFPNVWVVVSHVVATVLLLTLVIYLAWRPTKRYIAKRTDEIQKNMDLAEKARIEAEKNLEESKTKILESKDTAAHIIDVAEFEANEKRKKIESAAMNKASHIERECLSQLKKQELELSKRMNLEVSKLALETAEIFLSKKFDEQENKKLIDKIVGDLTKKVDSNENAN